MGACRQECVAVVCKIYLLVAAIATRPGVTGRSITETLQGQIFSFADAYSRVSDPDDLIQFVEYQGFDQSVRRCIDLHFGCRWRIGAPVRIGEGDPIGAFFAHRESLGAGIVIIRP